MDFRLSDEQQAVLDAVEKIAGDYAEVPTEFDGFCLPSDELDRQLLENGYYDIAAIEEFGTVTAALVVERLARIPWTVEAALSMLVLPFLPEDIERPLGLVERNRPGRFVASAKTLIIDDGDRLGIAQPSPDDVELVESIFAYPMGRVVRSLAPVWLGDEEAAVLRSRLQVACAAEMAGLMQGAIDVTVDHLSIRKQFGRPLGSFQALRHRLAECTVLTGGVRHLAIKAAATGDPGDAALAAFHAQDSGARLCYDVHQMMGAMGITLEMSLHLWTYRIKALLSELGGRGEKAADVARFCFAESL